MNKWQKSQKLQLTQIRFLLCHYPLTLDEITEELWIPERTEQQLEQLNDDEEKNIFGLKGLGLKISDNKVYDEGMVINGSEEIREEIKRMQHWIGCTADIWRLRIFRRYRSADLVYRVPPYY